MAERAKERGGTTARGGDETARSSRTFSDPPSDPQSTHQWQARKLEERAKVEKRRKEEARALTRRDADRRARSSDRGQDPFEAELDRMSDAEAMNRLDDVPISDLDTDYSSDVRGASRVRQLLARNELRVGNACAGGRGRARVRKRRLHQLACWHRSRRRLRAAGK